MSQKDLFLFLCMHGHMLHMCRYSWKLERGFASHGSRVIVMNSLTWMQEARLGSIGRASSLNGQATYPATVEDNLY